ncbi:hypothetical protein KJ713_02555 [Patescibacteria group bacterium]|nr:hypothetical protein [Patescibacteria group bacterium]
MKSGTPLTAKTLGQVLKYVVGAPWPDFMSEERAAELAGNAQKIHGILDGAFGESTVDWIKERLVAENAAHQVFFGQTYDLTLFRQTLERYGEDQVCEWLKLKLEPHFLPDVVFTPKSDFPGWKIRPNDRYWTQLAAGKLKRRNAEGKLMTVKDARLEGAVVLIDTRLKPRYHQNGKQMFADDKRFMGSIIEDLRGDGKISRYEHGPQSSRCGVSPNEWQEHIRPKVAEKLKLEPNQIRLELFLEADVIPQLYKMPRVKDGTTDTWVWYEEHFGGLGRRLYGGGSDYGGLAGVDWGRSDDRWLSGAVRPLVVFYNACFKERALFLSLIQEPNIRPIS